MWEGEKHEVQKTECKHACLWRKHILNEEFTKHLAFWEIQNILLILAYWY